MRSYLLRIGTIKVDDEVGVTAQANIHADIDQEKVKA